MARKVPLRRLLVYASLPAVLFPLLVLALVGPWQLRTSTELLEARIEEDLLQNAQNRIRLIEAIEDSMEDAAASAAAVWPVLARGESPTRHLQDLAYRSRSLQQLWVVSPDGQVRQSSHPAALGTRLADQPYWTEFKAQRSLIWSGIQHDENGPWLFRVVAPIETGDALVATYDAAPLQVAFRNPAARAQQRFSILIDHEGRVIAHSDEQQIGQDLSALPPVARALRGESGTMVFRERPDGPERSASYMAMPSRGWALVLTQPAATTMSLPALAVELSLLGLLVASILLAWLLTTLFSRRIRVPITLYSRYLERLASAEGTHTAIARPAASGIEEPDRMVESAETLYQTLAETIRLLEARSKELDFANQQLTVTVEDLKRLDRLRAEFLNVLSHDLRIPLTVMVGYIELLQDTATLEPEARANVDALLTTCHRMETMLNEFLDYARLESGRLELYRQTFDMRELVDEVQTFFQPLATQKQQAFEIDKGHAPFTVCADPDRVRQVMFNLVSNAIKYTPKQGCVGIHLVNGGAWVTIQVKDSGIGLSAEDQAHLFEKFFRSRRPEVQQEKGTGLGLVIAQGVLEAHGSQLEVESTEGHGATFRFTLPLAEDGKC